MEVWRASSGSSLPAFVVMNDAGEPVGGPRNWGNAWLPATFQGTPFRKDGAPILYLEPPRSVADRQQRAKLDLIADLKRRGLLDRTLVVWGGEFGRTPMSEKSDGRDHNPYGFSMFLAGGGIKGGVTHGASDEFGLHAVEDRVHAHDLHATILHLMGLDHRRLTFPHDGRDEKLTINGGRVIEAILV